MHLVQSIPFKSIPHIPRLFVDYINNHTKLADLYDLAPSLTNFESAIENRKKFPINRAVLANEVEQAYKVLTDVPEQVAENIALLQRETTYTVTTGHQLCLFTGPLYFIYKIITTIQLCESLKKQYPEYDFVPIFWMATEDHDFEEVNHFHLWGKKYTWQTEASGAAGRIYTHSLHTFFEQLPERFPDFEDCYIKHQNFADATLSLVNQLFGHYGLVAVNGDNAALKHLFKDEIKRELVAKTAFSKVTECNMQLESMGYTPQVHPREINLFYLQPNSRERIVYQNGHYEVLNTSLKFSEAEIMQMLDVHPENFSPNVVLRPLYQEKILPNVAYVGGPGEIAYWLQLKTTFEAFNIFFPILFPRNFALIIPKKSIEKWEKAGLNLQDLFSADTEIKHKYLQNTGNSDWKFPIFKEKVNEIFAEIKNELIRIDPTLDGFTEAQRNEAQKLLLTIDKKAKKASELKEQQVLSQLMNIHAKLFPGGNLQERHENILNYVSKNPVFMTQISKVLNVWDFNFKTLTESHEQ